MLEVRNLRKDFLQAGTRIEVLKDVNFVADKAETVAILGQSGSGKSTLLSLLAGLDKPSSGEVRIQGQALTDLDETSLALVRAKRLGIVFQQFHLMGTLTALENVSLALEILRIPDAKKKAEEALAKVGLSHRTNHLPHQLSGGECQRIAIARAYVARPEILLADEPSGNLDTRTGNQVMDLLFELVSSTGTSLLLVTHNEQLASRCHRRLYLEEGKLR
jgi:putative ABC transport system ATP-binding protein